VSAVDLPYFDLLLDGRSRGDATADVFADFVHWGLWPRPWRARTDSAGYIAAMERMNDAVVAGARITDGMTIADVGCGFGGTLARISRRFPTARLVGLNIDERQLANAIESRAGFVAADACRLPLATESCDAVLAVECIFHFPSRLAFLEEAARVLKPGGRLTLSDFVPVAAWLQRSWLGRKVVARIGKGYGDLTGWERANYRELARTAGLVVEEDRNVTARTLPTYLSLTRLALRRSLGRDLSSFVSPTVLLLLLSMTGIVRYRIVSFRAPGPGDPDPQDVTRRSHEADHAILHARRGIRLRARARGRVGGAAATGATAR
jgi:SAM-dependent methyltransferase